MIPIFLFLALTSLLWWCPIFKRNFGWLVKDRRSPSSVGSPRVSDVKFWGEPEEKELIAEFHRLGMFTPEERTERSTFCKIDWGYRS